VLATDEITESGTLTDATLQRLCDTYDDVVCRKLILIIAWFNLLARFLNGRRVPLETGDAGQPHLAARLIQACQSRLVKWRS
jgi:hypothetical protein